MVNELLIILAIPIGFIIIVALIVILIAGIIGYRIKQSRSKRIEKMQWGRKKTSEKEGQESSRQNPK